MQVVKFEMDVSTTQIPRGKGNSWSLFLVLCSMMCRTLSPSIIHLFENWDTYKWTHEKGKNYTRSSLTILSLNIIWWRLNRHCDKHPNLHCNLNIIILWRWLIAKATCSNLHMKYLEQFDSQLEIRPRCVTIAFMLGHHKNRLLCFQ